jgi:hypothetical protein
MGNFNWGEYTGYLAINHNCRLKISYYCTRQFLNLFGPTVFNCEVRLVIRM